MNRHEDEDEDEDGRLMVHGKSFSLDYQRIFLPLVGKTGGG